MEKLNFKSGTYYCFVRCTKKIVIALVKNRCNSELPDKSRVNKEFVVCRTFVQNKYAMHIIARLYLRCTKLTPIGVSHPDLVGYRL